MHLSTIERPWGKPFTNKRYIHPPFAENIVTMWPNSMVLIGEVTDDLPQNFRLEVEGVGKGFATELPSAGVVFTLKRESDILFRLRKASIYNDYTWSHDFMPAKETKYKTRKDGVPIHSFEKKMDSVNFYEEAFCDSERISTAYIKVTVENNFGIEQKIELGAVVRTGPEFLFTGCPDPDGYLGYNPQRNNFDVAEMSRYEKKDGYLTDGKYRLYFDEKSDFLSDGESDLNIVLNLKPYEKRSFTFAFTRNAEKPKPYSVAKKETEAFWKKELGKAEYIPDKKGIEPLFYNFLAQELQMFARPHGKEYTIMRQGATQRYHWPEAKEMVKALAHIGGYSEYIDAGLSHYFCDMQEKEGENAGRIFNKFVPWNSRVAAALEMFADSSTSDEAFFEKYIENAMLSFRWMEKERSKSSENPEFVAGLFPPGIATDSHFSTAQQWTFSDTAMLRGYKSLINILKLKKSPYLEEVSLAYEDYFGVMKGIFDKFDREQQDSEFLYLPRDPKNNPEIEEALNQDPFYYMFPNQALASGIAGYGTRAAEKVIHTYSYGGQSRNGLVYPVYRSVSGTGRTWYTSWAEHDRYIYYKHSGNREKCKELIDTLLKYNVTTEFYQCERYDDHDAYIAPWMPNASANGRLLDMLFDYYGKKEL